MIDAGLPVTKSLFVSTSSILIEHGLFNSIRICGSCDGSASEHHRVK